MFESSHIRDKQVAIVNGNLLQTGGTRQLNSCAVTRDLGHRCCSLPPPPLVLNVIH